MIFSRPLVILIPARLAATRLPDKPLKEIGGKTMIQHVWERVSKVRGANLVAVATPDPIIADTVERFGGLSVLTSSAHRSGTDRIAEAANLLNLAPHAVLVNVQGDEPLIDPANVEAAVAPLLEDESLSMSSLMCLCPSEERVNPACVKVVCALNGDALYFSRSSLPYDRTAERTENVPAYQHIGLYAYRRDFLATFASLPPSPLEQTESLEQLRVLENGYRIRMVLVENAPIGVDTPEDLERVRRLLAG